MTISRVAITRITDERGAVLIQVAVALLAVLALSSFVFDYGVMWVSKGQAQNAADAGALSGAIALAFDSSTDQAGARAKAIGVARSNWVWGAEPDVTDGDVTFPPCPPGAVGVPDTCVKVDVFRNQRPGGNRLPVFFSRLVGVADQGVRATATAQIIAGDTTECLRPWAVVDRWLESGEPFNPLSTYDRYSNGQGSNPPQENDIYRPPSAGDPGTGYTLPADEGRRYAIKTGAPGSNAVSSGWFRTIDLAREDTTQLGNNTVQNNILSCAGMPSTFATAETEPCPPSIPNNWADTAYWATQGCFRVQTGATVGSTANSIDELVSRDAGARWVEGQGIVGSTYSPPTRSPRVVPIGVMDIDAYLALDPTGNNGVLRMVNIYGFFIEGMGNVNRDTGAIEFPARNGQSVIGRIITIPSMGGGSSTIPNSASFLRSIILVR
jgi:hypothetical protein